MSLYTQIQEHYEKRLPLPFKPFYDDDYNDIRRLKIMMLTSILLQYESYRNMDYDSQINIVYRIENSCTNEAISLARSNNLRCEWTNEQFVNIYYSVCYVITSVLHEDNKDNKDLVEKIINKDNSFDINNIAKLTYRELLPEKYNDITHVINKRINTEHTVKFTEMHFCKKCKKNQTTAERVQNRSNDEASSFQITCIFCGTKWFK